MKRIIKSLISVVLAVGMLMAGIPVTAYAADKVPVREVPEGAEIVYAEDGDFTLEDLDNIMITEPLEKEEEPIITEIPIAENLTVEEKGEEEPIAYDPLTPDGNLTLADDYGKSTGQGKQFITFTTKTGEYFYLIIDRDDSGNETVHFLNQVDNTDILRYLEDEEVAEYDAWQTSLNERKVALEAEEAALKAKMEAESVSGSEAVTSEPEVSDTGGMVNINPQSLGVVVIILFAGGGFLIYCIISKKKKKQIAPKSKPADEDWDDEDDEAELEEEPEDEE